MGSRNRLVALAAACVLAACSHAANASQTARVGQQAPNWSEPALGGREIAMASLHGKPVYLNFFATWCPGCNEEAAALERISHEYRSRGLEVVGIDVLESPRKAEEFRSAHHLSFPLVADSGTLRDEYDVNALPVQVFIGRDGTVRRVILGQISLADMRSNVERILR